MLIIKIFYFQLRFPITTINENVDEKFCNVLVSNKNGNQENCRVKINNCRSKLVHFLHHHRNYKFICKFCILPYEEQKHLKTHNSDVHKVCRLPNCSKCFEDDEQRQKHLLLEHLSVSTDS